MTFDPNAFMPPVQPGKVRCSTHGDQWAYSRNTDGRVVADPTGVCGQCLRELLSGQYVACGTHGIQPKSARGVCPVCEKGEEIERVVSGVGVAPVFDLSGGAPEPGADPVGVDERTADNTRAPEFSLPATATIQVPAPPPPSDQPPPPEPSPEQREEKEIDPTPPRIAGVEPYSGRLSR